MRVALQFSVLLAGFGSSSRFEVGTWGTVEQRLERPTLNPGSNPLAAVSKLWQFRNSSLSCINTYMNCSEAERFPEQSK